MSKKIVSAVLALLMLMFAVPTTVLAAAVSELPSVEAALGQTVSGADISAADVSAADVSAPDVSAADVADAVIDAAAAKKAMTVKPAEKPAEVSAEEPAEKPAEKPAEEPAEKPEKGGPSQTVARVDVRGCAVPVKEISTKALTENVCLADSTGVTVESVYIYNEATGTGPLINDSSYLDANVSYYFAITLAPKTGYAFADPLLVTINGGSSLVDTASSGVSGGKYVIRTKPAKPLTAIKEVNFGNLAPPIDGLQWETLLDINADTTKTNVKQKYWYNDSDGRIMTPGEKFVYGKKYSLCVGFTAKSGYALGSYTVGKINGSSDLVDEISYYEYTDGTFYLWTKPVWSTAGLYVDGTAVTSVSNTLTCGSGTVTFNPNSSPATLTLSNAQITKGYKDDDQLCGILAAMPLKLVLVGTNSVKLSSSDPAVSGVTAVAGDLTVTGTGSLEVTTNAASGTAYGLESILGSVVIDGGTLKVSASGLAGQNSCGFSGVNVRINNGSVTVAGSSKAVSVKPTLGSYIAVRTSKNSNGSGAADWDRTTELRSFPWLSFEKTAKTALTEVGISGFRPPIAGETAAQNLASVKPTDPEKYSLASYTTTTGTTRAIYWFDGTANKAMQDTDKFVSGRKYYICAYIKAAPGYAMNASTKGNINSEARYYDAYSNYSASYDRFVIYSKDIVVSKVVRLAGASRTSTAAAISSAAFKSSKYVIIASGDNYADALAGVSLAGALDAPILLVVKAYGLDAATKAEIKRLGATNAIILGGTGAIPDAVETSLKNDCGCAVERLKGSTRFGTAVAIAGYMDSLRGKTAGSVFFVYAANYPDALAVSGVAAAKNAPILYIDKPGKLDADTLAYMKDLDGKAAVNIIGGTGVISAAAEQELKGFDSDGKVKRVSGSDRYQTCLKIDQDPEFKTCFDGKNLCVATGLSFPDALAGGVLCARLKAPMVLVPKKISGANDKYFTAQLSYAKSYAPTSVYIFGGEAAVSKDIENLLAK